MFKTVLILLFVISIKIVICKNILYLSSVNCYSHLLWSRSLVLGLVKEGHNVTLTGPYPDKSEKTENYTYIHFKGNLISDDVNYNEMIHSSPLGIMKIFREWSLLNCQESLQSDGVRHLLSYPTNHFDLILVDLSTGPCLLPFMEHFGYPPTIATTPFILPPYMSALFTNHHYSSYLPWYGIPFGSSMNFWQRIQNFFYNYIDYIEHYYFEYPKNELYWLNIFGNNTPNYRELEDRISLMLANTDPVLEYAQSLPPNIIPVGGIHCQRKKTLPKDLQKILDNAKNGAIVFSLGSMLRSERLSTAQKNTFINVFAKLNQTVIWKFEDENIKKLPANVIVRKWLPQSDVLAHSNVRLFIGHGGAMSSQEAVYHGVPLIIIPFILDQYYNAYSMIDKGIGLQIDLANINEDDMYSKIKQIVDDPRYLARSKKFASLFKDQPQTPLERAIFWVEYMLKHGDLPHLNLKSRNMSLITANGLDVLGFLIISILILTLIIFKIIFYMIGIIRSKFSSIVIAHKKIE